jgi:hypothetical protein
MSDKYDTETPKIKALVGERISERTKRSLQRILVRQAEEDQSCLSTLKDLHIEALRHGSSGLYLVLEG